MISGPATEAAACEFAQWLQSDSRFVPIPFVILSEQASRDEPVEVAGLSVRAFVQKTGDVEELGTLLRPVLP